MLFAWPQILLASLVLLFGAFALADGVANVVTAVGGREEHESWWLLLAGLAGIGVCVLTFFNPEATALALLVYIAIWAIATGLLEIVAAIRLRKEIEREFWLVLAGLGSVVLGMLLVAKPEAGALAVLWLIAAYTIVLGAILILLAFEARGFVKRVKAAVTAA